MMNSSKTKTSNDAASRKQNGRKISTVLLILLVVVVTLFAGVKLMTGSSLFSIFSAAFSDDYTPSVGETPSFLPEGNTSGTLVGESSGSTSSDSANAGTETSDSSGGNTVKDTTRKEGVYNFLVCGVNHKNGMNNSDAMMVVNYDVKKGSVNIVQLPRDAYFTESGRNFHKINSYFTAYYNHARNNGESKSASIKAGMEALSSFIETNYCIKIDYYVYLNLDAFVKIVDAIGGVTVEIPYNLDYEDSTEGLYIHLKKGVQTLSGEEAVQFVRFRKGYANSDYGRMDAQKIFMTAFIQQVKDNFSLSTVVSLATSVFGNLETSIPSDDFIYFAKSALSVDLSKVTMQTLPSGGTLASDGLWYDVVCRSAAIETINSLLNVYQNLTVTEALFDRNEILYDHNSTAQTKIYFGEPEEGSCDPVTGDQAGNITIPKG